MLTPEQYRAAIAQLTWQVELGADEAIGDAPVDRYALDAVPAVAPAVGPVPAAAAPPLPSGVDPVDAARRAAAAATTLDGLTAALGAFEGCELKRGSYAPVHGQGPATARLMILTDPPGRAEERAQTAIAGEAGALLGRMLAAIGLSLDAVYIAPILPWRLPPGRDATLEEWAMMRPFLDRAIALVDPAILVALGDGPARLLMGGGAGRLRGTWGSVSDRPVLVVQSPAALLRDPILKRAAWDDLRALATRLRAAGNPPPIG